MKVRNEVEAVVVKRLVVVRPVVEALVNEVVDASKVPEKASVLSAER